MLRLHSLLKHLILRQHRKQNKKTGPKLIEEKFTEIHDVATEFIKRNGYKAQEKRRNDDFVSCGVSVQAVHWVQEVREHLKTIPGLAEHGLSKMSVKYLFKPVHQGRRSAKLYKGVVDCKVPRKDNSGRQSDEHSHYLHVRVNMSKRSSLRKSILYLAPMP